MSRDIAPFPLRIPEDLNERVEKSMEESLRSKNAELVYRLSRSFDRPLDQFSTGDLITELLRRFDPEHVYIRIGKPGEDGLGGN